MSLLEMDERLEYICKIRNDKNKNFLKDLSSLIYYGTSYGVATTQSTKPIEKQFHNLMNRLFQSDNKNNENPENDVEASLRNVFK